MIKSIVLVSLFVLGACASPKKSCSDGSCKMKKSDHAHTSAHADSHEKKKKCSGSCALKNEAQI